MIISITTDLIANVALVLSMLAAGTAAFAARVAWVSAETCEQGLAKVLQAQKETLAALKSLSITIVELCPNCAEEEEDHLAEYQPEGKPN